MHKILTALGIVAGLLATTGPAATNPSTPQRVAERVFGSADPAAAYRALSPADRTRADSLILVAHVSESTTVAAGSRGTERIRTNSVRNGCYSANYSANARNALGGTIYRYWHTTTACFLGGRVTSVRVSGMGGETSTIGWRKVRSPIAKSRIATSGSGQSLSSRGIGMSEHFFVLGAGGWDIQHPSSCLRGALATIWTSPALFRPSDTNCNLASLI